MEKEFSAKPFSLSHYLAIKSAKDVNNPAEIFFHYQHEPEGEWWQKAKLLMTLNKVQAPDSFMGRPLHHAAHKADVIRLQALTEYGGIYLDLDTICVRPLTELLPNQFVMGQELNLPYVPKNRRQEIKLSIRKKLGLAGKLVSPEPGLCNAVLLAEKNSEFISKWMEEYRTFRSMGRDKYWNEHSGKVPLKLAHRYPHLVKLLGPYAFHYPLYNETGMRSMFEEVTEFPGSYLHHLWESFSWEPYLKNMTVKGIFEKDTTYNLIARRFL